MNRRVKFFILTFLLSVNVLFSQTELLNHKKYYYYKTRLQNDFMKIGLLDGESIPFNERSFQNWNPGNPLNIGKTYQTEPKSTALKVGDASARLGIYLAALASEYRLLKNNGQDVTKVKHEIFCALNAINRIDFNAELLIGSSNNPGNSMGQTGPNLNGFFVRDDIDANFVKSNYKHFNYYNSGLDANGIPIDTLNDKGFTQTFNRGQTTVFSDRQRFLSEPTTKPWNNVVFPQQKGILNGFEESQDQVIYIMMGCAMVKELVDANETDNGAVFGFGAGGSGLKQQAIDIVDRLITHIKNDPAYNIRNPANSNAHVQTGQISAVTSYALDNAACFIKHNGVNGDFSSNDMPNFLNSNLINTYPLNACTDFRNNTSMLAGGSWHTYMGANFLGNDNNNSIFSVLASLCNCYYESKILLDLNIDQQINNLWTQINSIWANLQEELGQISPLLVNLIQGLIDLATQATNVLSGMITNLANNLYPSVKINSTDEKLTFFSKSLGFSFEDCDGTNLVKTGSDLIFPIYIRDILHQNNSNPGLPSNLSGYASNPGHLQLKNQLENILNTAPCSGNFYMFPNIPGPNWGVSNRCDLTDGLWHLQCSAPQGEFAGTDYMLLHNLFYLREGHQIGIIDYQDRKVSISLPIGNNFTLANKRTMGAFEFR